jgi:hypothetical protein
MGAGTGRGDIEKTAEAIARAAISWLESSTDSSLTDVYFLAWTDVERDAWRRALEKSGKVRPV